MSWIVTADGREVSLQFPQMQDFDIGRIAHSLAQINRFTGHAARPYSVAEHSLLVLDIAERHLRLDVHGQLVALLHDAHEAYTNDLSTPAKHEVGSGWRAFEVRFAHLLSLRFGCHTALTHFHSDIQLADRLALATERAQLMPKMQPNGHPCTPWPVLAGVEPMPGYDLMDPAREAMTWRDWRNAFIDRFEELQFARAEQSALRGHAEAL